MAATVKLVELRPETLRAFDAYVRDAEAGMEESLHGGGPFLWSDSTPERIQRREKGKPLAELWAGTDPIPVPEGLIHDWVGAVSVPGATLAGTLALVQDYDNHKNVYAPDVADSKLIRRAGDDFRIFLRLLKKKIITVVLDTDHEVHYSRLGPSCSYCFSRSTRIAEVQDAGKPTEATLPADTGHGFLWRLYSYWKFQERDGRTIVECRAISLTRDIPPALKWLIQPMVRSLPKESLVRTLAGTQHALALVGDKA
jgi:hypothetical protein